MDEEKDLWIVFTPWGQSAHDYMYLVRQEQITTFNRITIYEHHLFYQAIVKDNQRGLADFITRMALAIKQVNDLGYVHSDVRLRNILVKIDEKKNFE